MTAVLVLGTTASAAPPGIDLVRDHVELRFADDAAAAERDIADAEIVFAWRGDLLEGAWPHATALRWVQSPWAGVESLLFPALVESEVVLTNARGVFDAAVAEWTLAAVLFFAKDLGGLVERRREHRWEPREVELLSGRRLLVVGPGSIGRQVARAARSLGLQVRGVGRRARTGDPVFGAILGIDELPEALGWADVVVNVLPATPQTERVFDVGAFAAMRPGTRFVNVGRGSAVDEDALVAALRAGRLGAAALGVTEVEPLPASSPLWDLPNVLLSPHSGAAFGGWREAVVERFVENLDRFLRGAPLRGVVDKRAGFVVER
ncbi:MAG: D-2-hydroxyacid dehydrogenase [Actinomycetota bacterium]